MSRLLYSPGPIIEGPVEIRFATSKGKQKVTFIIDFGKSDVSPSEAGNIVRVIVANLRMGLGVRLSKFK